MVPGAGAALPVSRVAAARCGGERCAAQPADGDGRRVGCVAGGVPEPGGPDDGAGHAALARDCAACCAGRDACAVGEAAGGGGIAAGSGRRAAGDCGSTSGDLCVAACRAAGDSYIEW